MNPEFEDKLREVEPPARNRAERRELEKRRKKIAKKAAMEVKKHMRIQGGK